MTNTNIQGPIPLEGRGLTYKPSGDYGKGEFSTFTNVELVNGTIQSRRPIAPVEGIFGGYSSQNFSIGFIGEDVGGIAAVGTDNNRLIRGSKHSVDAWSPTLLPQPPTPDDPMVDKKDTINGHFIIGFFRYNHIPYWLTHKVQLSSINEYWLFKGTADQTYEASPTVLPSTSVKILSFPTGVYDALSFLKKIFIHKDRLWIATKDALYFSKATDPTDFTVPNGGFVKVEQGEINDAAALSDTIFITSTYKTYAYTYSTDPNADALMRPIIGGQELGPILVSQNDVYTASPTAIYQIVNNQLRTILDLKTVARIYSYQEPIKLCVLGDTLFILRGTRSYNFGERQFLHNNNGIFDVLMLNLESGAVSSLWFKDNEDNANWGSICDMATPSPVGDDQPAIYFAVTYDVSGVYKTRFYYMNQSRSDYDTNDAYGPNSNSGLDWCLKSNNTIGKGRIEYDVTIENFSPDGTEYLVKKFRQLLIEGKLPLDFSSKINLKYDSNPEVTIVNSSYLWKTLGKNRALPYPYRMKLNQRSKTLTINFKMRYAANQVNPSEYDATLTMQDVDSPFFFILSDLRTLWGYTQELGRTD